MPKHQPYSRLEFRRRLRAWIMRNIKLVGALTVGLLASIAFIVSLVLLASPDSRLSWWVLGALPTAMVAAYLHLLHTAFIAHDAEAIWHVRGAWGEDNTRDELRRAKRKKIVWGWVDSLALQVGDIDHLVVTRRGGLVAVDSKWRSRINDATEMARAAQKVRLRAEGLTRDLLKGDSRGARRAKVNPLSVTAVVVLWGPAQHGVPEGARVDGIEFIAGRDFVSWLRRLDGHPVDEDAADDVVQQLEVRRSAVAAKAGATRP
jgi:hypothetical protein